MSHATLPNLNSHLDHIIEFGPGSQSNKLLTAIANRAQNASYASRIPAQKALGNLGQSYAAIQHPAAFNGATKQSFQQRLHSVAGSKGQYTDQHHHRRILAHHIRAMRAGL